jgi:hypothetical protein
MVTKRGWVIPCPLNIWNLRVIRALTIRRKEIEKLAQRYIEQIRTKASEAEISRHLYKLLKPIPEISNSDRIPSPRRHWAFEHHAGHYSQVVRGSQERAVDLPAV